MSILLGELRALQRERELALVLVHHLRKNGDSAGQEGLALRGSGDLHAWGDSNLYLRRAQRCLRLVIEHRAAPSPEPIGLELSAEPATHLRVVDEETTADPKAAAALGERIVDLLATARGPLSRDALRAATRTRNATLGEALVRLRAEGRIERCGSGFRLRPLDERVPVPAFAENGNGNGTGQEPSV
jgi:hypothetical protein